MSFSVVFEPMSLLWRESGMRVIALLGLADTGLLLHVLTCTYVVTALLALSFVGRRRLGVATVRPSVPSHPIPSQHPLLSLSLCFIEQR